MEKSSIEILTEFAEKTNRKAYTNEHIFRKATGLNPTTRSERNIYIPDNVNSDVFYIANDNYSTSLDKFAFFSGIFVPVEIDNGIEISMEERNIITNISSIFKKKGYSTGDFRFDRKVKIDTNNPRLTDRIFRKIAFKNESLKILKIQNALRIGTIPFKIDFVESFKDKFLLGAYTTIEWIMDEEKIEALFNYISEMKDTIEKAAKE